MALVLIVVDEPDTLLQLLRATQAAGHRAVLAADADTALERLGALAVDVVILDVMMPVRDGWMVLEALRDRALSDRALSDRALSDRALSDRALSDRALAPPAIVLSGRAGPLDVDRAERLGAAGWLAAPFSPGRLDQSVALALAGVPTGST